MKYNFRFIYTLMEEVKVELYLFPVMIDRKLLKIDLIPLLIVSYYNCDPRFAREVPDRDSIEKKLGKLGKFKK